MAVESPQRDDAPLEDDEWVETLHSVAEGLDTNVTITLINSLLDEGAEIDEIDPYGKTPLQYAMEVRNKGAALALLARGADINIRFEGYHTILHSAAVWGERDVITRLLEMGGDIAAVNCNGQTPMHCAVWGRGDEGLVRELLSRGGDITIAVRDRFGLRLWHHAALEEKEPMKRLLLETHCTLLKTLLVAPNAVTAAMLSYPLEIVRSQFEWLSKFTFGDPNGVIYPNLLGFLLWQEKDYPMAIDCYELGLLLDVRNTISTRLGEIHHQYAECNICRNTIIGIRHRCKECEDFDICTNCDLFVFHSHPYSHQFQRIPENKYLLKGRKDG